MKLYEHQIKALEETAGRNRVAYYFDMGLGKTFIGSEKMRELGARVNLVICQKSKVDDWTNHFKQHYPDYVICNLTKKKDLEAFQANIRNCVGIINYELAFRRPELLEQKDITLMLDESSIIQNKSAKQTKFVMKLQAKNVILLSGTPCSGKYENLWTQAHLLGWDITEKTFLTHYINYKKINTAVGIKKIVDQENPYRNQERLKTKLRTYGAVFTKTDEVFDLPEQNIVTAAVETSKDYKTFMKKDIVTVEGDDLIGTTQLTKLLYARELCGPYSNAKQDAFKDLLASTNDRLIVFYNFKKEAEKLTQIIEEQQRPWSIVSGDKKDLEAYDKYEDSVTLVQYQSGSKGLNLQKANKIIYYTPTLSVENWMQSQKRIHRIGQNRPCFYYKLVCSGSVEEKIYEALERGVDYTDELFKEETKYGL